MRYLIWVGVAWNSLFYPIYFFLYIFLCPTASSRALQCQAQLKIFSVAACAINVASDFYTLLIPLAAVSNLQLASRRKIGLLAIFFTGFL